MRKSKVGTRIGIFVIALFLGIGITYSVSAEQGLIPSWIKTTASFWVDDKISDSEFIQALQFLVENEILVIPEKQENCDPHYPEFCIAPYPPDLDCGEIQFANFKVLQPDPHGFDRDKDGIGCKNG